MATFHVEGFNQQLLIVTVLGGFSFSCASQLVTSQQKKWPYYVATGGFMTAAAIFLGLLLADGLLLMNAHRLHDLSPAQDRALDAFTHIIAVSFTVGLGFLLLGSALLGWLHSRLLGFVSLFGVVLVLEILRRVLPLLKSLLSAPTI